MQRSDVQEGCGIRQRNEQRKKDTVYGFACTRGKRVRSVRSRRWYSAVWGTKRSGIKRAFPLTCISLSMRGRLLRPAPAPLAALEPQTARGLREARAKSVPAWISQRPPKRERELTQEELSGYSNQRQAVCCPRGASISSSIIPHTWYRGRSVMCPCTAADPGYNQAHYRTISAAGPLSGPATTTTRLTASGADWPRKAPPPTIMHHCLFSFITTFHRFYPSMF